MNHIIVANIDKLNWANAYHSFPPSYEVTSYMTIRFLGARKCGNWFDNLHSSSSTYIFFTYCRYIYEIKEIYIYIFLLFEY